MFHFYFMFFVFFFQAEDGIRDATVTGVQTCALPIFLAKVVVRARHRAPPVAGSQADREPLGFLRPPLGVHVDEAGGEDVAEIQKVGFEIGRASCRERGWRAGGGVTADKKRSKRNGAE